MLLEIRSRPDVSKARPATKFGAKRHLNHNVFGDAKCRWLVEAVSKIAAGGSIRFFTFDAMRKRKQSGYVQPGKPVRSGKRPNANPTIAMPVAGVR
jgi:hypothetical protein